MKYLTKEWLIQYKLSYINSVTKKSKQAQTQNIVYYNNLYRNRYLKFIELEKSERNLFGSPQGFRIVRTKNERARDNRRGTKTQKMYIQVLC